MGGALCPWVYVRNCDANRFPRTLKQASLKMDQSETPCARIQGSYGRTEYVHVDVTWT